MRKHFTTAALLTVLLLQTSCVAVMVAANAKEVDDRRALKQWFAKDPAYADCETPLMIAPIIYHDFDGDQQDELVIVASSCMTGTAGPDIHTVLSRGEDGEFIVWQIPEISPEQYAAAEMQGNRNYRFNVINDTLIATWRDRSERALDPLVVKYRVVDKDAKTFAVADIDYGN